MLDRSKVFAATLLTVMFVAGGAVGIVMGGVWDDDNGHDRGRRGRERMSYTERLDRALDLSEAQRESVTAILDRRQVAMRGIWRDVEPRFDSLRAQIRSEILALLDSAQQQKFLELITHSDSARDSRGRGSDGRK
ncbi:MAG: periplasmic heavy metal sensor [Gemmatimonadales bacterium]